MAISLQMVTKVTEENFKEKMMRLVSFDSDWDGSNGLDYVSDEAKEQGFTSDAEYVANLSLNENSLQYKILNFIHIFRKDNLHYYTDIDSIVSEEDDGTFSVSLSAYTS